MRTAGTAAAYAAANAACAAANTTAVAETLAMKGLTINCLGDDKKEEAYDLVKKVESAVEACGSVYVGRASLSI